MPRHTSLVPTIAFALAAAAPFMLGLAPQDTYTLRLNPGEATYKQNIVQKSTQVISGMADMTMTLSTTLGQTVKFAKADKSTSITVTTEDVKVDTDTGMDGMDPETIASQLKSMVVKITADARGKVEKTVTEGASAEALGTQAFENALKTGWNGIALPENPVSVGSKWNDQVDLSKLEAPGAANIKITSGTLDFAHELVAVEEVDGIKCAKIHVVVSGTIKGEVDAGIPMEATITVNSPTDYWIDLATGVHTKVVSNGKFSIDLGMVQVAVEQTTSITNKKGA